MTRTDVDADVLVVGAGPAGSSAACFLADAGARVLLVDRRTFPREKPCGEGILPPGVEVLERLGVAERLRAAGARSFGGIRYHAPSGRTAVGRFPRGASGLGVRRFVLDAALLDAARARPGVRVIEGFHAREIERDATGAVVGIGDGSRVLRAPLTIGADGSASPVRRAAGLDGPPTSRRAVRMHFHPAVPPPDDRLVDVYVGGASEAYVTPVARDEFGVALLTSEAIDGGSGGTAAADPAAAPGSDTHASRAERAVRAALAGKSGIAASLAAAPAASAPMAAVAVGTGAVRDVDDGLLLLGDAAGAPDPITGMGISFALRCASLLPAALAQAFRAGDFSRARLAHASRLRRREVTGGFAVTAGVLWLAERDLRAELAIRALRRAPGVFTTLFRIAA